MAGLEGPGLMPHCSYILRHHLPPQGQELATAQLFKWQAHGGRKALAMPAGLTVLIAQSAHGDVQCGNRVLGMSVELHCRQGHHTRCHGAKTKGWGSLENLSVTPTTSLMGAQVLAGC